MSEHGNLGGGADCEHFLGQLNCLLWNLNAMLDRWRRDKDFGDLVVLNLGEDDRES